MTRLLLLAECVHRCPLSVPPGLVLSSLSVPPSPVGSPCLACVIGLSECAQQASVSRQDPHAGRCRMMAGQISFGHGVFNVQYVLFPHAVEEV
jgi:hypothetical protein